MTTPNFHGKMLSKRCITVLLYLVICYSCLRKMVIWDISPKLNFTPCNVISLVAHVTLTMVMKDKLIGKEIIPQNILR